MKRTPFVAAIVLLAAVLAVTAITPTSSAGTSREPAAPVADAPGERLQRGGYVVYFRHAATDMSMTDSTDNLADCTRQRNLTASGRADARAIGQAWRRSRLPVGAVLSSPYCRTRDTARLAFGRFTTATELTALPSEAAERARFVRALRRLLARRPAPRQHDPRRASVQHRGSGRHVTRRGGGRNFRAARCPRFRLVAKVRPRAWARLAP